MNNKRRKILHQVLDDLDDLKKDIDKNEALNLLRSCAGDTERCADDEQMALDNRPETLEFSTTTADMEDNVDDLYEASSNLEMVIDDVEEMEVFVYDEIKSSIIEIVNLIKQVIHR